MPWTPPTPAPVTAEAYATVRLAIDTGCKLVEARAATGKDISSRPTLGDLSEIIYAYIPAEMISMEPAVAFSKKYGTDLKGKAGTGDGGDGLDGAKWERARVAEVEGWRRKGIPLPKEEGGPETYQAAVLVMGDGDTIPDLSGWPNTLPVFFVHDPAAPYPEVTGGWLIDATIGDRAEPPGRTVTCRADNSDELRACVAGELAEPDPNDPSDRYGWPTFVDRAQLITALEVVTPAAVKAEIGNLDRPPDAKGRELGLLNADIGGSEWWAIALSAAGILAFLGRRSIPGLVASLLPVGPIRNTALWLFRGLLASGAIVGISALLNKTVDNFADAGRNAGDAALGVLFIVIVAAGGYGVVRYANRPSRR